jgi:transposase
MSTTAATRAIEPTAVRATLYIAFELGNGSWKLGFTTGPGQRPRERDVSARDGEAVLREIARARRRFQLSEAARVVSCYEAGRDGFWLHRFLVHHGIENRVVDSSSIEVKRRQRRAKTDRMDVEKLLGLLMRYEAGERKAWSVVRVPAEAEEDARQLHRELLTAKRDRTRVTNRIRGLLANQGLEIDLSQDVREQFERMRQWDGSPLPPGLRARLEREWEQVEFVTRRIRHLQNERRHRIRAAETPAMDQVRQLLTLRGIGVNSAWLYTMEFFGWRQFRSGKEIGALAGLTPTPHQSGELRHELGIAKAGNRRIRWMSIEGAWAWLRFQPQSALSQWYQERFGGGGPRMRKVGIVALARKLLIALWRFLETGVVPEGAELKTRILI